MHTVKTSGTFKDAIARSSPKQRKLSNALRNLIAEVYPDVVEVPWPKLRVIGYGIGPKKNTEHFCYIACFDTHVNLGFNYGSKLPDPNSLLDGAGKKFRHIKISDFRDLKQPGLKLLLRAAVMDRQKGSQKSD